MGDLIWKARWYRGQLVDLPDRVHHPPGRLSRTEGTGCTGRALHPVRLLPLGYHLEVRCGAPDLPDFLRQVAAREGWHPARLSAGRDSDLSRAFDLRKFFITFFDLSVSSSRT